MTETIEVCHPISDHIPTDLCYWYATDGHPHFRPMCLKSGLKDASIKCYSRNPYCPDYKPSEGKTYE
jgi:hypothetical protein